MLKEYRNKNQHVAYRYQMQDQTIGEKKYKIIEMKLQNEEICSINTWQQILTRCTFHTRTLALHT